MGRQGDGCRSSQGRRLPFDQGRYAECAVLCQRLVARDANGVEDLTPITPGGNAFFVTVEGEAGAVLGQSSQPYTLRISALDLDDGVNPNSAQNNFTQFEGAAPRSMPLTAGRTSG